MLAWICLSRNSISLHTRCYDSAGPGIPGLFEPFRSVDAVVSVVLESLGPISCKQPAMSTVHRCPAVNSAPPPPSPPGPEGCTCLWALHEPSKDISQCRICVLIRHCIDWSSISTRTTDLWLNHIVRRWAITKLSGRVVEQSGRNFLCVVLATCHSHARGAPLCAMTAWPSGRHSREHSVRSHAACTESETCRAISHSWGQGFHDGHEAACAKGLARQANSCVKATLVEPH